MFQGAKVIKLTEVEPKGGYRLALRFSDGAVGVFDFAPFVDANTPMGHRCAILRSLRVTT
jgi:hypothetical protein